MPNSENILSIDLEEWYHPEYVKDRAFSRKEERVTKSFKKTLDLLQEHDLKATYFILGELAERHPEITEEISENGHEIAFHGYNHEPLWKKDPESLKLEIDKFHSAINSQSIGFRAPSFSLNNKTKWALKVLEDKGFQYDSSIFPIKTPLYGVQGAPTRPYKPSMLDVSREDEASGLWEFPPAVYTLIGLRIPVGGGFYLRFLPISLIKRAIRKLNKHGFPAVLFFHNWELDSETPRMKIGLYRSFVTYHNLERMEKRLGSVLTDFKFTSFRDYLEHSGLQR